MEKFIILSEITEFGSTGENSFGFITSRSVLFTHRPLGCKSFCRFIFKSPEVIFPDSERIKIFRSVLSAQRWIATHTVRDMSGSPVRLIIRPYRWLFRNY